MANLVFEWDRSLLKSVEPHVRRALFSTLRKSGGDALRTLRTSASRELRARKWFKASAVAKGLDLRFPSGAREIDDLEWVMGVQGAGVPLIAYPHRQTKRGVQVRVNRGKGGTLIKGAFIATMKSGHEGVFMRNGKKMLSNPKRDAIEELYSTRLGDPFKDSGMVPGLFVKASAKFSASFARLLPLELEKAEK